MKYEHRAGDSARIQVGNIDRGVIVCALIGGAQFAPCIMQNRTERSVSSRAQATQTTSLNLKEQWSSNIVGFIRLHLKDVKKGWFNLDEVSNRGGIALLFGMH